VISRPTTDQLIADVCQDLVDAVLPALTDETATLLEYANAVNARIPNVELTAALAAFDEAPQSSLHLADVVETYERASQAFAAALAGAQREGTAELIDAARELLHDRISTEKAVMATYAVVGR